MMKTRQITMNAMAVAIVFTQEQLLVFLPNVQFTVMLLMIYTTFFTKKDMFIIIISYVLLDSMVMGAMNPFYMAPMLLGWFFIPFSYHTWLRKTHNEIYLALFALLFGFVYGWMFIPFNMIQTGIMNPLPYLIADIPFEITMGVTGFLQVMFILPSISKILREVVKQPDSITAT